MWRYGRGGALLKVRIGTMILPCLCAATLLSPSTAHGLSIEPVLDTVLSAAKLSNPEKTNSGDNRQGIIKSDDNSRAAVSASSSNKPAPLGMSIAEPAPVVVAEPLAELPSIEAFNPQQKIARISQPVLPIMTAAALTPASANVPSLLQVSNQGWTLLNVAWYVWMLAGLISWYATRAVLRWCRGHMFLD